MSEYSGPFATGSMSSMGDPLWREFVRLWVVTGVHADLLNKIAITAGTGRSVLADTGYAVVEGCFYKNDASGLVLALAENTSGQMRNDRIVLRLDNTNKICNLQVKQGTPGAGLPTPQQDTTIWELPIAHVDCASGFSQIVAGNIHDDRVYSGAWGMGYGPSPATNRTNADKLDGIEAAAFLQSDTTVGRVIAVTGANPPDNSTGQNKDFIIWW